MKAIIETERLLLCHIDPDRDFERWAETLADVDNVRYIGGKVMDKALAWRNMATIMGHWQIRGYGFFSVLEKDTHLHVGRIGPWAPEGWPAPEIGWTLHPDSHGKGYAVEAGRACVDYAFNTLGWNKVIHVIQEGNTPSVAVAEKLGSKRLETMQGIPGVTKEACWIYGQERP